MFIKRKKKSEEQKEQERRDKERMWNLFMEIWRERPHFSELSGRWLGREPLTTMFDHLLEKERWPDLKYEKGNIILITSTEHDQRTKGHPSEEHKRRMEQAKQKFIYGKQSDKE